MHSTELARAPSLPGTRLQDPGGMPALFSCSRRTDNLTAKSSEVSSDQVSLSDRDRNPINEAFDKY